MKKWASVMYNKFVFQDVERPTDTDTLAASSFASCIHTMDASEPTHKQERLAVVGQYMHATWRTHRDAIDSYIKGAGLGQFLKKFSYLENTVILPPTVMAEVSTSTVQDPLVSDIERFIRRAVGATCTHQQESRNLMLPGPPGVGKTHAVKHVARQCGMAYMEINGASIAQKYVGQSSKAVEAAFTYASKHQPIILFLDECEDLMTDRTKSHKSNGDVVTAFLRNLCNNASLNGRCGIVMIAATNIVKNLDPAILSRFRVHHVATPDVTRRRAIWPGILAVTDFVGLDDTTLERLASYPFHDIRLMAKATEEAKELIDADPSNTEAGRVDLQSTSCILWSVLDKFVKQYKLREKGEGKTEKEPIIGLNNMIKEILEPDMPINQVSKIYTALPQHLRYIANTDPGQVVNWVGTCGRRVLDEFKSRGGSAIVGKIDVMGQHPHTLVVTPVGDTNMIFMVNVNIQISTGLAEEQMSELKKQSKKYMMLLSSQQTNTDKIIMEQEAKCKHIQNLHSDAIHEAKTLHTQEIHELKTEIRELRDLLVSGLGNSRTSSTPSTSQICNRVWCNRVVTNIKRNGSLFKLCDICRNSDK
jgi:Ni2+-binding GTPase involved in maturation of urease and hydrogenase